MADSMSNSKKNSRLAPEWEVGEFNGHALAMHLRQAYLALHRATNACLAEEGMTADSFIVLTSLAETDALTQKELAQRIDSDVNTISAMLTRLERFQLVNRKRDAKDGRARVVSLTDRGRELQARLWKKSQEIRSRLAEGLTRESRKQVIQSLQQMMRALRPAEKV